MKNIALAVLCVGLCVTTAIDSYLNPETKGKHGLEALFAILAAFAVFTI